MKSILVIVPYDNIYPPMNGGMQRCFHIIHQLAKHFNLTAIIHQDKESFLNAEQEFPAIRNIRIFSTKDEPKPKDLFRLLPIRFENALRYRWIKKSWHSTADGNFLKYYPILKRLLKTNSYDTVLLENLSTLNTVSVIRKYGNNAKIIYDAHNVDSNLGKMAVERFGMKKENLAEIQEAESTLHTTVDGIFTCSHQDQDDFKKMNDNKLLVSVIPNGVNVGAMFDDGVKQDVPEYILFCGSLWSLPNSEGLFWFYKNCWNEVRKNLPDLKLLVVGSGKAPGYLNIMFQDESVEMIGTVDDVKPWYNKVAISIVPLLTGSGTRLKILEAMSLGVPVVSTALGAEGIEHTDGKDIVIMNGARDFSKKVVDLLMKKTKRIELKENARKLVEEKYDWNVIGEKINIFLKDTLN
jgi:polysaccharide biosynthesis protein PslH